MRFWPEGAVRSPRSHRWLRAQPRSDPAPSFSSVPSKPHSPSGTFSSLPSPHWYPHPTTLRLAPLMEPLRLEMPISVHTGPGVVAWVSGAAAGQGLWRVCVPFPPPDTASLRAAGPCVCVHVCTSVRRCVPEHPRVRGTCGKLSANSANAERATVTHNANRHISRRFIWFCFVVIFFYNFKYGI